MLAKYEPLQLFRAWSTMSANMRKALYRSKSRGLPGDADVQRLHRRQATTFVTGHRSHTPRTNVLQERRTLNRSALPSSVGRPAEGLEKIRDRAICAKGMRTLDGIDEAVAAHPDFFIFDSLGEAVEADFMCKVGRIAPASPQPKSPIQIGDDQDQGTEN